MFIDRGMEKGDVTYVNNRILLNHKKEWSNVILSNMNRPDLEISVLSQREKNWYHMKTIFLWNLKKKKIQMVLIYKTEKDPQT